VIGQLGELATIAMERQLGADLSSHTVFVEVNPAIQAMQKR
jgi:hypothetical protein